MFRYAPPSHSWTSSHSQDPDGEVCNEWHWDDIEMSEREREIEEETGEREKAGLVY